MFGCFFFETGSHDKVQLDLWPSCLTFASAGIRDVHHNAQSFGAFYLWVQLTKNIPREEKKKKITPLI
jgi:hypothetical protein